MSKTIVTQHTPGPWTVEQSYDARSGPHVYVNAEIENDGTSKPSGSFSVAEVSDDSYLGPYGSQEANARLIAAAPELLACLRRMCGMYGAYSKRLAPLLAEDEGTIWTFERANDLACEAIAKAEGAR